MRGVAVIDESFDDAALARLDRAGVRGVRFNVLFKGGTPLAQARVIGERIRRFGWHVQLLIDVSDHPSLYDDWKDFPVPVVVDHMGHMAVEHGVSAPGFVAAMGLAPAALELGRIQDATSRVKVRIAVGSCQRRWL
jgi:predicted TIM-barrel fold metal-dependent hydrolase